MAQRTCARCSKPIVSRAASGLCRPCLRGEGRRAECHPDRKHFSKGKCQPCYKAGNYAANREPAIARARAYYAANGDSIRAKARANPKPQGDGCRKYKYGITIGDFKRMLAEQGGRCAICLRAPTKTLCVDHCHTTGKVRKLLCHACNMFMGVIDADADTVERLKQYAAEAASIRQTAATAGVVACSSRV